MNGRILTNSKDKRNGENQLNYSFGALFTITILGLEQAHSAHIQTFAVKSFYVGPDISRMKTNA